MGRLLISMEVVSFVVEVFVVIIIVAGGEIVSAGRVVLACSCSCSCVGMIISSHAVLLAAHHRPRMLVPVLPYGLLKWRRQHILLE